MDVVFPVILPVPPEGQAMKGRARKDFLSEIARRAVRMSAEKKGMAFGDFQKDARGCPMPENGGYWSLSHKPSYVAGIAARRPVGIDVEPIRPVDERLLRRIADERERALAREDRDRFFFRLWTAKEAVAKAVGGGYPDIFRCRVAELADADHLVMLFNGRRLFIEHRFFDGHVASLVSSGQAVSWEVEESRVGYSHFLET